MNDIKDTDWLFEMKPMRQLSKLRIETIWHYSDLLLSFLRRFITSSCHHAGNFVLLFDFTSYFSKNINFFLFRFLLPSKLDITLVKYDFNMVLLNLSVSTIFATIDLN